MKKTATLFLSFLLCFMLGAKAQLWEFKFNQPPATPSLPSSWAAVNYTFSYSGTALNLKINAAGTSYLQYNPGGASTIATKTYKLLRVRLANETDGTVARFYFRNANAWIYIPFNIDANSGYKDYTIDLASEAFSGNGVSFGTNKWEFTGGDADASPAGDGTHRNMPIIRFDLPSGHPGSGSLPADYANKTISIEYIRFGSDLQTLPVNLARFTAKKQANGIQLNWSTASEENNSHFDILRSADAVNFEKIAREEGKGNSNSAINYQYTDTKALPGTNYYQLNQVDFDGKTKKSEVVAVNSGLKNVDFKVYSGNGAIKISAFASNDDKGKLLITDISGRKIIESPYAFTKGQNVVELSSVKLTAGVYVVTLAGKMEATSVKFTSK
ncbi:hypothetical protein [Pedobacter helvus]|jgi:hypothetical protein|uniref:Secretion system C-terminal sorting domain-containing protein n=1 Tax=Pedobacter helvus TaxID=2563444 RepID=A0ABW9JI36_9SPHI|nr:hypothetical protein [Pedobacter ureilyticus]